MRGKNVGSVPSLRPAGGKWNRKNVCRVKCTGVHVIVMQLIQTCFCVEQWGLYLIGWTVDRLQKRCMNLRKRKRMFWLVSEIWNCNSCLRLFIPFNIVFPDYYYYYLLQWTKSQIWKLLHHLLLISFWSLKGHPFILPTSYEKYLQWAFTFHRIFKIVKFHDG